VRVKHTLLIELLTEELPPKALDRLGLAFSRGVKAGLADAGFATQNPDEITDILATPRRLAVLVPDVLAVQPERAVERKGPYVAQGLNAEGKPSQALLGFAKSCGIAVDALEKSSDAKGEFFVFRTTKHGEPLELHLARIVREALSKLPTPKVMRWGDGDAQFVRPVHGLVMMLGKLIIPGEVLGISSTNRSLGHRFIGNGQVEIPSADAYLEALARGGRVIVSFNRRKNHIAEALHSAAARGGGRLVAEHEALLEEVTALVEHPTVYQGHFDSAFLQIPQECLILSMQQHQRYFPLLDAKTGKLLDRFLIVSNLETDDPKNIVKGNERVLRARLSDAKFFYDQDRKTKLADRVERLDNVVYHNKLGSQLERVQRIGKLASSIAEKLGTDVKKAERAAWLSKADLLTDMVGEFPELQGTMGRYYALHDGEDSQVARAIEEHYLPRLSGDKLPADNIGCAVALADKLDTLVGIYGIGLVPTGDKDPFGLRRQALGVLRILSEKSLPLDLLGLLSLAKLNFTPGVLHDSVAVDLHGFVLERLRSYLRERGFAQDEIEAVVSQNPTRIDQVVPRLEAVRIFRAMPEAESLASANKRIRNILKKTSVTQTAPDPAVLQETAERDLFAATSRLLPRISSLWENGDYTEALRQLAGVRREVDTFFDQVMVMTDEPVIRNNRLALLSQLERVMNQVADISKLAS
jgi:glycyl-tRNA synthetase beta chain